jgi:spore germination protein
MRRRHLVVTVAIAAAVALAAWVVAASASNQPAAALTAVKGLAVTGYIGDWNAPAWIGAQARALTTVGVDGINVTESGTDVSSPSSVDLRLLRTAHAHGLAAVLLVGNSEATGFSTSAATRLLTSRDNRARVAAAVARIAGSEGWDGVTVDLESLAPRDAQGLVAFVARLRLLLPRRFQLAVDVSAVPSLGEYAQYGYHLASLSRVADVVLMAYDEDGPWSSPGPIGGLPWQRAALASARRAVPARRLVLGVAAYGYTWPPGAHLHDGATVSAAQARRMAAGSKERPRWNPVQGEWTVRLRNGTVLWWSDVRSYVLRRAMAARDGLAGLAVWQLASSDHLPRR